MLIQVLEKKREKNESEGRIEEKRGEIKRARGEVAAA